MKKTTLQKSTFYSVIFETSASTVSLFQPIQMLFLRSGHFCDFSAAIYFSLFFFTINLYDEKILIEKRLTYFMTSSQLFKNITFLNNGPKTISSCWKQKNFHHNVYLTFTKSFHNLSNDILNLFFMPEKLLWNFQDKYTHHSPVDLGRGAIHRLFCVPS